MVAPTVWFCVCARMLYLCIFADDRWSPLQDGFVSVRRHKIRTSNVGADVKTNFVSVWRFACFVYKTEIVRFRAKGCMRRVAHRSIESAAPHLCPSFFEFVQMLYPCIFADDRWSPLRYGFVSVHGCYIRASSRTTDGRPYSMVLCLHEPSVF